MNLQYFYEEQISASTQYLSEETTKHWIQVLRMKEGQKMELTNGRGAVYTAVITHPDKKQCAVNIETVATVQENGSYTSIAISLLKNPSRLEWFMEKATEVGVFEIIPLICDHTEKQNFRADRMRNILISAMLQSKQARLPTLHQPKKFIDCISEDFEGVKMIAHCAEENKIRAQDIAHASNHKLILIGPEGDFSKEEIELALAKNFIPVSLGNTRLRTETAGIVAATLLAQ